MTCGALPAVGGAVAVLASVIAAESRTVITSNYRVAMAAALPRMVMIFFGAPIEPRRVTYPAGPNVTDPPLEVDELPGLLAAWQRRPDGWVGQVTYGYPVHGLGLCLRYVEWLPAARLRPCDGEGWSP